jgi:hypothetical protein
MKRLFLSAFMVCSGVIVIQAQTYTMANSVSGNAQYVTTCSGTFVDNGGAAANYANGQDASYTFYPAVAGQYTRLTFTSFNTESTYDYLFIYDGPSGPLIGSYTGNPGAFTVTASSSNSSRGLTCRFYSDGSTTRPGWSATVSCVATPGPAPAFTPSAQDCNQGGGTTVCDNANFTANSSGPGVVDDLNAPWDGCLTNENQSSWYYFSPSSAGTVGFTIAPANGSDDYDFAVWGPFNNVQCPVNISIPPLRCSYSGLGGNTGCGNGAVDVSEGAGGDKWVSTFSVLAGEVYVLVIDNYVASGNPFTLSWSLTAGADLNCTVLPVELLDFTGQAEETHNHLSWQTATEINNDYFIVDRSVNGGAWDSIGTVDGHGNSTQVIDYEFNDFNVIDGISYYRLRQRDFNGATTGSPVIYIVRQSAPNTATVYPSPTPGDAVINYYSFSEGPLEVTVMDVTGRIVSREQHTLSAGSNTIPVRLENEPAGVYTIRMTDPLSGSIITQRLIRY